MPGQGILTREQGILRLGRSHRFGEARTGRFGGDRGSMVDGILFVHSTTRYRALHQAGPTTRFFAQQGQTLLPGYSVPVRHHLIGPIRPTRRHIAISPHSGL